MKFKSHVPNFVDAEPAINEDNISFEELMNHEWIKRWIDPKKKNFHFCWDGYDEDRLKLEKEYGTGWVEGYLMCEWEENGERRWWVLGYTSSIKELAAHLPEWKKPSSKEIQDKEMRRVK